MTIRLVSFDLDGTLVDTAAEIAEAVHRAFDDVGIERRPQAEITNLIGRGTRELMLKLLARVMLEQPALSERVQADAVLERFEHHYAETAGCFGKPYPGCVATLERLRDQGVRLVCVTNKEQRHAERVLAVTRLDGYFSMLIGGDTLPVKKPHNGVLAHVLRHHGVSADEAAHVGDSSIDVESARNAGVRAWAVPHGYNAGVPIEDSNPDRLFPNLSAIADEVDAVLGPLPA